MRYCEDLQNVSGWITRQVFIKEMKMSYRKLYKVESKCTKPEKRGKSNKMSNAYPQT